MTQMHIWDYYEHFFCIEQMVWTLRESVLPLTVNMILHWSRQVNY